VVGGLSGIDEIVEQAGDEWAERLLLRFEEVSFGLAHLAPLRRVAVVCVVGDGDVFTGLLQLVREGFRVQPRLLVIDEVLQVVGVAAFFGHAEQDHRFGDEDAPLRLLGGGGLVDLGVAVVQRLHLRREDAPAVLRAHREQASPDILTVSARP